eukprot:7344-Heterococcus_DN1.PRE.2
MLQCRSIGCGAHLVLAEHIVFVLEEGRLRFRANQESERLAHHGHCKHWPIPASAHAEARTNARGLTLNGHCKIC